jgi:hypothetical protein
MTHPITCPHCDTAPAPLSLVRGVEWYAAWCPCCGATWLVRARWTRHRPPRLKEVWA